MSYSRKGSPTATILLTGAAIAYWEYVQYFLIASAVYLVLRTIYKLYVFFRSQVLHFRLKDVDSMSGIAFEYFVVEILKSQGYSNVSLTEKYDYGVDIVAEKNGTRWGIQAKRYRSPVKAEAVRQAYTALNRYGCSRAMVITNSTFTRQAYVLANDNNIPLIGREILAGWIYETSQNNPDRGDIL
jgi:restriction system protein